MKVSIGNSKLQIRNSKFSTSSKSVATYTTETLTVVGAGSWTKPLGVTEVIVKCWGGGGTRGGCSLFPAGGVESGAAKQMSGVNRTGGVGAQGVIRLTYR